MLWIVSDYRVTQSQNCRGWKGPLEISESNTLVKQFPTVGHTSRCPDGP